MNLDAVIAWLINPAHSSFLIAYILVILVYQIKERRKMLALKAVADFFFGAHLYFMKAHSGAYAVSIAILGGLIQVFTPDRLMKKTATLRVIIATVLSLLGIYFVAQKTTDALPMFSVVVSRFTETQENQQHIRLGFLFSTSLWILYSVDNELYLMLLMSCTIFLTLLVALFRHKKDIKEIVSELPDNLK